MGHIPAGMELFKFGKSQWQTITKCIDESDIYILILGGRYGLINLAEGKSYIHLEYEYALSQGKPTFTLVLEDDFINKKEKYITLMSDNPDRIKYEDTIVPVDEFLDFRCRGIIVEYIRKFRRR